MGGKTFDKTIQLNEIEYNNLILYIENLKHNDNYNLKYLTPFRLGNKNTFGDVDIILSDTELFIDLFSNIPNEYDIIETKTIPLLNCDKYFKNNDLDCDVLSTKVNMSHNNIIICKEKQNQESFIFNSNLNSIFLKRFDTHTNKYTFTQYSKHILTKHFYQIDLLKSWNVESMEITRAYFSYSFANIFLKQMVDIVDRNLTLSHIGILCSSNKYVLDKDIKFIQLDNGTRLIIDCEFLFNLVDLDYNRYTKGFVDEIELLEYFSKSKYYPQIKFKSNSKFKHDYSRLKPFANLVNLGLIQVENFIPN